MSQAPNLNSPIPPKSTGHSPTPSIPYWPNDLPPQVDKPTASFTSALAERQHHLIQSLNADPDIPIAIGIVDRLNHSPVNISKEFGKV